MSDLPTPSYVGGVNPVDPTNPDPLDANLGADGNPVPVPMPGRIGGPPPAVPGWEGSVGPFKNQYHLPHVYARDVHSGAGNCVCGRGLGESKHVQAAPGVPIPDWCRA